MKRTHDAVAALAGHSDLSPEFWSGVERCLDKISADVSPMSKTEDGRVVAVALFEMAQVILDQLGLPDELSRKLDGASFEAVMFFAKRDAARLAMGGGGNA